MNLQFGTEKGGKSRQLFDLLSDRAYNKACIYMFLIAKRYHDIDMYHIIYHSGTRRGEDYVSKIMESVEPQQVPGRQSVRTVWRPVSTV